MYPWMLSNITDTCMLNDTAQIALDWFYYRLVCMLFANLMVIEVLLGAHLW